GHFQYFLNKAHYDHGEVVDALRALGASKCARILAVAMQHLPSIQGGSLQTVDEYLLAPDDAALDVFDRRFGDGGDAELMECLRTYLTRYENEFVRWVP